MNRWATIGLVFVLSTLSLTAFGSEPHRVRLPGATTDLLIHQNPQTIEPFTVKSLDGNIISTDRLSTDLLVINLWATWCTPCLRELPSLDQLADRLSDTNISVIGLAIDEPFLENIGLYAERLGIRHLPLYSDFSGTASEVFRVAGLPMTIVVNGAHEEVARMIGVADWSSDAAVKLLQDLLEGRKAP